MKEKKIKSKVNIRPAGKGFFIEIKDGITNPIYAVTSEELEMIVLIGSKMIEQRDMIIS